MTFVIRLILLVCSFAWLSPVMACTTVDGYDRWGDYLIADKGSIDGIRVNYPNYFLSELYDMPGVPDSLDEDYAKALRCWAEAFGIALPADAAADLLNLLADGGFDDVDVPYDVQRALDESYDYDNAEQPIQVHHILRDILFMQTMQHSIREWERDYITSLEAGDFLETEEAYEKAEDIFNVYLEYQETRDYQNILLSVIFGAGENEYGKVAEGTLPSAAKGHVKGLLTDIAKNKLSLPGAKPVRLEPDGVAIAEFVVSTFITYYDNIPNSNNDIVLLLDVGNTTAFGILNGGLGLLMAPGLILQKGLTRIAEIAQNVSKGAQLVNYYFLAKHYPELVKNNPVIFNEFGALHLTKRWGNYRFHIDSIGKEFILKKNAEAFKTIELLTSASYGMHEAITSNKEMIDALYGMANFFIAVDQLDITQLKKNLTGFAYLKYLKAHGKEGPQLIPYQNTGASLTAQFKVNGHVTATTAFTTDDSVDLSVAIQVDAQDVGKESAIYVVRLQQSKGGVPEMKVGPNNWQPWASGYLPDLKPYATKVLGPTETVNVVEGVTYNAEDQFSVFVAYQNANGDIIYNGEGGNSIGYTVVKPSCVLPSTPMLEVTVQGNHVKASWTPAPTAEGYKLYYALESFNEGNLSQIAFVDMGNKTVIEDDLDSGTQLYVAVQAYNCAGASHLGHVVLVKTPAQSPTTPGEVFRDTLKDGSLGPEMVWIPAGTFRMGDLQGGGYSNEEPVHEVSVNRFAMGKYEVTFAEYDKFAEATGRTKPNDMGWGRGNRPVIYVSWDDATAYAEWLTQQTGHQYRLPTEAEWEYAARAGTETKYWWGNEIGSNKANCYSECGDSFEYTAPVGSFPANPFGLHDTAGNIWEWACSEYESSYNGKEQVCLDKESATDGSLFSVRGGSWFLGTTWMRTAYRDWWSRTNRNWDCGFRLARMP